MMEDYNKGVTGGMMEHTSFYAKPKTRRQMSAKWIGQRRIPAAGFQVPLTITQAMVTLSDTCRT
jgi:hypothetical protein